MELAKRSRGVPKSARGPPCLESGGTLRSAVADASLQAGQTLPLRHHGAATAEVRLECACLLLIHHRIVSAPVSGSHSQQRLPAGAVSRPPLALYAILAFPASSALSGNWNGCNRTNRRKAAASQRQSGRFAVPRSPQHPLGPCPHHLDPQPKWVSAAASRHQACRRCSCHRRPRRRPAVVLPIWDPAFPS